MKHERILGSLILSEVVLAVLGIVLEYTAEPSASSSLRSHLEGLGIHVSRGRSAPLTILWGVVVAATILAWVGLLFLLREARPLYVATWAGYLALILFRGPVVETAAGGVVQMLMALTGGAIVGLVYFSELRTKFRRASEIFGESLQSAT